MSFYRLVRLKPIIVFIIIINLVFLVGCNDERNEDDKVGAGPTIENMNQVGNNKDKDDIIEDAIMMSEEIMRKIDKIDGIDSSMVYINHEAVLTAVRLSNNEYLSDEIRNQLEETIYKVYPNAKTIAISDDEYVYESISRLLRSFKENDPVGELKKDLEEIINSF